MPKTFHLVPRRRGSTTKRTASRGGAGAAAAGPDNHDVVGKLHAAVVDDPLPGAGEGLGDGGRVERDGGRLGGEGCFLWGAVFGGGARGGVPPAPIPLGSCPTMAGKVTLRRMPLMAL